MTTTHSTYDPNWDAKSAFTAHWTVQTKRTRRGNKNREVVIAKPRRTRKAR